jgi:hypothetical protein
MSEFDPGIHRSKRMDCRVPDNDATKSGRSAKAPLRNWQDTIARQAPVQDPLGLPQWTLPE